MISALQQTLQQMTSIPSSSSPPSSSSAASSSSGASLPSSSTSSTFLTGVAVGIGFATMFPNYFPNLEYRRRQFVAEWWGSLLSLANNSSSSSSNQRSRIEDKVDAFSVKSEIYSMVLPNWIDRNKHMNNARYLYELNFARRQFFQHLHILPLLTSYQSNLVLQSQTIRYRRELKLWQMFIIEIRILDWNDHDHSFYLESTFLDAKTRFVHAIHHSKYRIVSAVADKQQKRSSPVPTPSQLLRELKLIDQEEASIERTASEESQRTVEPELILPQNEDVAQEETELLQETKRKLAGTNLRSERRKDSPEKGRGNSFLVFWETANTISSQQLNPQRR